MHGAVSAELVFGRDIGGAPGVSDAQWAEFVDEDVTPRFPEGFTVKDASGQWRGEDGGITREASKVLTIVLPGRTDDMAKLEAVRAAYKARFRQESVLLATHRVCAGF